MKKLSYANWRMRGFDWTRYATAAVTSRPTNIHRKAWLRKAACSRASGLTPSWAGDAYGAWVDAGVVDA